MDTAAVVLGLLITLGLLFALISLILETGRERGAGTPGHGHGHDHGHESHVEPLDRLSVLKTLLVGGVGVAMALVVFGAYGVNEVIQASGPAVPGFMAANPPRAAAPAATGGMALLEARGCLACHALGGQGSAAGPGPDLTGVGSHAQIAGVLAMNKENLVRWLANPASVKPGTAMPPMPMSDQEREQIAEFLLSQR